MEAAPERLLASSELPVNRLPIACSCAPEPWVRWGSPFKTIMSFLWAAISGSIVPSAGRVQLVSVPVGHHFSGTMPFELNTSSSRGFFGLGRGPEIGPNPVDVAKAAAGKTIAIFGLPGAFTPTCSAKHVPGYLQNNEQLKKKGQGLVEYALIIESGREVGEKFWQLPLDKEYSKQIKSDIADIKNVGGRKAGTITAAIFNQPCHGAWEGDLDCWASTDGGVNWRFRGRAAQHEPGTNRMNCAAGLAGNGDLLGVDPVLVGVGPDPAHRGLGVLREHLDLAVRHAGVRQAEVGGILHVHPRVDAVLL